MESIVNRVGSLSPASAGDVSDLEKSLFFTSVRQNPVFFILYSLKESLKGESEERIAKALAKASFIMIDGLESRIRYEMKRGRREALAHKDSANGDSKRQMDLRNLIQNSYTLFIRRVRRKRDILALILESVERFYEQNRYEELLEIICSGSRSLAHIDIMISLYEEEAKYYGTS
ncbi:hypothetical protein NNO_1239 [Hydrogenimonas sp.]|nr:hypothetical protein NNO_1239 [Hydrogenimonas sp.]